jgi:hypothetical protein
VGVAHRFGGLADPAERGVRAGPAIGQHLLQRASRHQFHDDEAAGAGLLDRVHLDEGRMAQRGRHARLAHQIGGACRALVPDALDGDAALQPAVPGFMDLAMAAFAETGAQGVVGQVGREARAGCRGGKGDVVGNGHA